MERDEIIKALECCKSPKRAKCNGCPREEEDSLCMYRLNEDALALINSQEQRIGELTDYKNGYEKGCEDSDKKYEALKEELQFTRQFIHDHGLEFALASEWEKAKQSSSAAEEKRGHWITHSIGLNTWAECSNCLTCGSPHWKVCPVCEAKMEEISDKG